MKKMFFLICAVIPFRLSSMENNNLNLCQHVQSGNLDRVRDYLVFGADANGYDIQLDRRPLHVAASTDNLPMIDLLLKNNAHIEATSNSGCAALHRAVEGKSLHAIQYLADKGANIHAQDCDGWTPLHFAVANGDLLTSTLLVMHGANILARTKDGMSLMHMACKDGYLAVAQQLYMACPQMIHAVDNYNETPLHLAVYYGHAHVVAWLVGRKAIVDVSNNKGKTPLYYAIKNGSDLIIGLLTLPWRT